MRETKNIEWTEAVKNAEFSGGYIHDTGSSFVYVNRGGHRYLCFWGSQDAKEAQRTLQAWAEKRKNPKLVVFKGVEKQSSDYQINFDLLTFKKLDYDNSHDLMGKIGEIDGVFDVEHHGPEFTYSVYTDKDTEEVHWEVQNIISEFFNPTLEEAA